jgi:hypothetical protein
LSCLKYNILTELSFRVSRLDATWKSVNPGSSHLI